MLTPKFGCLDGVVEAFRTGAAGGFFYGKNLATNELGPALFDLHYQFHHEIQEDPDVQRTRSEWQECMRQAGYVEKEPGSAIETLQLAYTNREISLEEPQEAETEMASADAECYDRAKFGETLIATEKAIEGEIVSARQSDLVAVRNEQSKALLRASNVI